MKTELRLVALIGFIGIVVIAVFVTCYLIPMADAIGGSR